MKILLLSLLALVYHLGFAQPQTAVDVTSISAEVFLNDSLQQVSADVDVRLNIRTDVDSVFLDAQNFTQINSASHHYTYNGKQVIFYHSFKANQSYLIHLSYTTSPKQSLYFTGALGHKAFPLQIWTQGQGKYTSHWLPSLDDMTDKIEFDLSYRLASNYSIVANGRLENTSTDGIYKTWQFDMQQPMSSYLVAFAAGQFTADTLTSASGIKIYNYLPTEEVQNYQPTYQHSLQLFNFLEKRIGVSYPWQNYKQVGVRDFLYSGMENTSCTLFSNEFYKDNISINDTDFTNVEAHELAHQWFGNLVTETSGEHHWLQEGFATYFAYLAQEAVFGVPFLEHQLFTTAETLTTLSNQGKGEAVLNPKASSLTFYEKGAWALHALRNRVGDAVFFEAIANYLVNYAYKNVTTDDFLAEVQSLTSVNLSKFKADWLLQTAFPAEEAQLILKKSDFIAQLFSLKSLREQPVIEKEEQLREALLSQHLDYFGPEVSLQITTEQDQVPEALIQLALGTKHLKTRQVLVKNIDKIPSALQEDFESLLDDASYITREHTLLKLWLSFPEDRSRYLEQLDGQMGNNFHNIELLHLMLSAVTFAEARAEALEKLSGYTNNYVPYQIKRQAFLYLFQLGQFTDRSLINLTSDLSHPVWRYRNFCKQLFEELLKDHTIEVRLNNLYKSNLLANSVKLRPYFD